MPPKPTPLIQRLSQTNQSEPITMLIYGASGSGKTRFAGSAGNRSIIINTGDGLTTLKSPGFKQAFPGVDPMVINIPLGPGSHDQVCDTIDYLFDKELNNFDTLIIDDATALRRGAMWKAIQINSDLNKSPTLANAKKYQTIVPQVQDYGEEMNVVAQFLAAHIPVFKQNNKNFILTAHEKLSYRKGEKIGDPPILSKIRPGFTGTSFPDDVPAFFDEVWWFNVVGKGEKRKFRATTLPSEMLTAKTRWHGLFKEIEESITFPEVERRIQSFLGTHTPDEVLALETVNS